MDDLVRDVSAVAERERREREVKTRERAVENYLASLLPAPLVQRQEVAQVKEYVNNSCQLPRHRG